MIWTNSLEALNKQGFTIQLVNYPNSKDKIYIHCKYQIQVGGLWFYIFIADTYLDFQAKTRKMGEA